MKPNHGIFARIRPGFQSILMLGIAMTLLGGCLRESPDREPFHSGTEAGSGTCHLLIQFGDDRPDKSLELPCSDGSTVFDLLRSAEADEKIELDATGEGATAFVRAIDGVANRGGKGHNWVYYRNDQLGDRSCGVCPVKPGDRIRWTFGAYQPPTGSENPTDRPSGQPAP